jgi:iron complex transport system permease protein
MPARRALPTLLALAAVVCIAAVLGLAIGPLDIAPLKVLAALGVPTGAPLESFEVATIRDLRLPRVVLAVLVGAALAQAGAAMQGLFRNPLAEPGLAGVSSGAALAAVAVIVLGERSGLFGLVPSAWVLPLAAFAGGALAAWLVARLAQVEGSTRVATMLLAGLAVNAIAAAGIGFFSQMASDLALRTLTFWMFGSLGKADWTQIGIAAPLLLATLALQARDARALDALLLGEPEAGHLGVDVEALKRRTGFLIVLAVATCVALAGAIGFVGLLVPHVVRLWAGPEHRLLLPASALLGAALLCIADTVARVILAPLELPIGILTALIGGPFFLALLLRYRDRTEAL